MANNTNESVLTDPVFQSLGAPFLVNGTSVTLNERAIATKCAAVNNIRYTQDNTQFEQYDTKQGLWTTVQENDVIRMLDKLLLELGNACEQKNFVAGIKTAKLHSLAKMLRVHDFKVQLEPTAGLVHVTNGVLSLKGKKPKLLEHDPRFRFCHSNGITFNAKAGCPKFLKQFLEPALDKNDIALVQKYCGSMLLGPNTCHGIMLIRGTPGGGKSTLVSIIEKVIGETNVAHLRTSHLGGRFETSAFLGKRLLVGKDVPGDTLAVNGARMLKSLSGNDLMQAEIKYDPQKQAIRGDYHIVIVSNNNLKIALDGDEEAWRRRLLIVDFNNPKPAKPIPNLAEQLFAEEASGILNWLLTGAAMFATEMKDSGHLCLTKKQTGRIDTLLENSDNIPVFVNRHVEKKEGADVTSEELLVEYYRVCKCENWTPVSSRDFLKQANDIIGKSFQAPRRHDILRDCKAVRGFKNVTLV